MREDEIMVKYDMDLYEEGKNKGDEENMEKMIDEDE